MFLKMSWYRYTLFSAAIATSLHLSVHPFVEAPQRKCLSFDHNSTFVVDHYDKWIPTKYKGGGECLSNAPLTNEYGEIVCVHCL